MGLLLTCSQDKIQYNTRAQDGHCVDARPCIIIIIIIVTRARAQDGLVTVKSEA